MNRKASFPQMMGIPFQMEDKQVSIPGMTLRSRLYVSSLGGRRSKRKVRRLNKLKSKQFYKKIYEEILTIQS